MDQEEQAVAGEEDTPDDTRPLPDLPINPPPTKPDNHDNGDKGHDTMTGDRGADSEKVKGNPGEADPP